MNANSDSVNLFKGLNSCSLYYPPENAKFDFVFIAGGGEKKIYRHDYIPFLKLGPERKPLIMHTLDKYKDANVKMIITSSMLPGRLRYLVDEWSQENNHPKEIHVIDAKENLTSSILYAIERFTHFSDGLKPFCGDHNSSEDMQRYVRNNPESRNIKMLGSPCEIPFAMTGSLNDFMYRFLVNHYNFGSEYSVLWSKKEKVVRELDEMSEHDPHILRDFMNLDSTIRNFNLISGEHERIANLHAVMPFRVNSRGFDLAHLLYETRNLSHIKSWPPIAKVIFNYLVDYPDLREHAFEILSEVANSVGSGERLQIKNKTLKNFVENNFSKGSRSDTLGYYAYLVAGLSSYIDSFGGFDTMFDPDDLPSLLFAELHHKTITEFFNTPQKHRYTGDFEYLNRPKK
jgi:hypothetical protein